MATSHQPGYGGGGGRLVFAGNLSHAIDALEENCGEVTVSRGGGLLAGAG